MMRKCHLNTCPVGVATQDPVLRRKFRGQPEHVINYFFFVAEEVRELMAQLGVRKFNDLIGRTDLLDMKHGIEHWKAQGLDFSRIFYMPQMPAEVARYHCEKQDHGLEKALDNRLIELARAGARARREGHDRDADPQHQPHGRHHALGRDRASATATTGCRTTRSTCGSPAPPARASARSWPRASALDLIGDTNDYCGKGLSGGRISVQPSPKFRGEPTENIITGNVVLYGAIAGEAYFRGVAGERFAVRNSGAHAVVEGVGDHGCEYMTGGTVVVLGHDRAQLRAPACRAASPTCSTSTAQFAKRCNTAMVELEPVLPEAEQEAQGGARPLAHGRRRTRRS